MINLRQLWGRSRIAWYPLRACGPSKMPSDICDTFLEDRLLWKRLPIDARALLHPYSGTPSVCVRVFLVSTMCSTIEMIVYWQAEILNRRRNVNNMIYLDLIHTTVSIPAAIKSTMADFFSRISNSSFSRMLRNTWRTSSSLDSRCSSVMAWSTISEIILFGERVEAILAPALRIVN